MSILKGESQTLTYLSFDGVNDYVDIPTAAIPTGNSNYDISVTFIKKGQNAQNNENAWIYFYNPEVPSSANGLILTGSSNLGVSWWGQDLITNFTIQDDVKYTVRQTYDGTTRKVYVNGNEIVTDNPSPRSGTSKNDFVLGIRTEDNERGLNGEIFDFRVFNSIQSQSTMENNLIGNENGLVVAYNFNEGNGTTLNDLSGNNNDGTIVGATWNSETVTAAIENIYYGSTEVPRVYLGGALVYGQAPFNPITATGGSISDVNIGGVNYRIHAFTSTGTSTFTVNDEGTNPEVDTLVVAGGGGGGEGGAGLGGNGGGGAGGLIYNDNVSINNTNYSITVGDGGSVNNSGQDSVAFGQTAIGGGYGQNQHAQGGSGGSGGGAGQSTGSSSQKPGGLGTSGQGFDGGATGDTSNGSNDFGGGGGGAGQEGLSPVGKNAGDNIVDGGDGLYFGDKFTDNFGENGWFAGGGAGGDNVGGGSGTTQNGGLGGGGDSIIQGFDATPNTGGGGGGSGDNNSNGGDGGSGIVLIRYRLDPPS